MGWLLKVFEKSEWVVGCRLGSVLGVNSFSDSREEWRNSSILLDSTLILAICLTLLECFEFLTPLNENLVDLSFSLGSSVDTTLDNHILVSATDIVMGRRWRHQIEFGYQR